MYLNIFSARLIPVFFVFVFFFAVVTFLCYLFPLLGQGKQQTGDPLNCL